VAHLALVRPEVDATPEFSELVPPLDLAANPLRPGHAYGGIRIGLEEQTLVTCHEISARESFPLGPWLAIQIESQRALQLVSGDPDLVAELDRVARSRPHRKVHRGANSRLAQYANALRARVSGQPSPSAPENGERVTIPVSSHAELAWNQAAVAAELDLERWLGAMLRSASSGRLTWEAASAEQGQGLAEWILFQAALRR
jgi:hypothetical protein